MVFSRKAGELSCLLRSWRTGEGVSHEARVGGDDRFLRFAAVAQISPQRARAALGRQGAAEAFRFSRVDFCGRCNAPRGHAAWSSSETQVRVVCVFQSQRQSAQFEPGLRRESA